MRRALVAALGLSTLACASGLPPLQTCDPNGAAKPLCGYHNPEDLVALPGERSLLVSEYGGMEAEKTGLLSRLDLESERRTPLYRAGDGGTSTPGWGAPDCPGPPEAFSPHGIDLVERADGAFSLLVVNHAGREAVEFFEVAEPAGEANLEWRGCTVMPDELWLNEVVARPDGSFFATHMMTRSGSLGQTWSMLKGGLFGLSTGYVIRWSEAEGVVPVPGTEAEFPNGIALSPDGNTLFVNASYGAVVRRVDLATGRVTGTVDIATPDNSAWAPDGRLTIASLTDSVGNLTACFELEEGACAASFEIVALDPETLAAETVYRSDGITMGAGTVGLVVGSDLFVGSFSGNRVLRVDLDTNEASP